jgi:hypothetical protein
MDLGELNCGITLLKIIVYLDYFGVITGCYKPGRKITDYYRLNWIGFVTKIESMKSVVSLMAGCSGAAMLTQ